ncbi:MAG: arginine deiminase family protein [Myxococcota bacterium]
MGVQVHDEVSPLKRALVHEPGNEVDVMIPDLMEELLFDDILYGERARDEHGRFRRVLQLFGVEVQDAATLLAETLDVPEARLEVVDGLLADASPALREELLAATGYDLATQLLGGRRRRDATSTGNALTDLFSIPPLPNYCFQRDTQVVIGDSVVFTSMASRTRRREARLTRSIFRFHPDLRDTPVLLDLAAEATPEGLDDAPPLLEGGDVLVLGPDILAVGLSERTNRTGIRKLARALEGRPHPRWLVVVELPKRRAYMHLDTLITMVDHGLCLAFPPVILDGGAECAGTWVLDRHASDVDFRASGPLLPTLASLGLELEPIPCGGADPVRQHREQWTDGANTLAIRPGVITLFDRNVATLDELSRRGFAILESDDLLLGKAEPGRSGRVCVALRSHEISRARGGPHCLSHPLSRA